MKIVTILGARPQFIKAGSISRAIAKYQEIEEIIVHTGQHYDTNMSDVFFEQMCIPKPNYNLGVGGKSHGSMTGEMMIKIEKILLEECPDWVLVYGDTNSTLAGALAAGKLNIKIAHVEAGLRSFNMHMPEEINRILTDRISNLLFCPTDAAINNLKQEGFENFDCKIIKTGDVMLDGAMFYKELAIKPNIELEKDFILCTVHRAENTDDEISMKNIFGALEEIAKEKQVVLPLHPRTRKILENLKLDIGNLTLIEPVGYLEMVWLLSHCSLVLTDSGGLQKEAYFFGKYCITLRNETEWVELVEHDVNTLVGAHKNRILEVYKVYPNLNTQNLKLNLYGNGKASTKIIEALLV